MIRAILDLIAPDHCYLCGKIGTTLCESCVYNITEDGFGCCILCLMPTSSDNLCMGCSGPLTQAWVVGERSDVLQRLTDDSKFSSNRRDCVAQAKLLDRILPRLPADTKVVPIPTIWPHIRQRGFGHAEYVAHSLADIRSLHYSPLLARATNSVQHGASRRQRQQQAERAYTCESKLSDASILLVDDVCTTGASLVEAAKVLRRSGASSVWAAVTVTQMLE